MLIKELPALAGGGPAVFYTGGSEELFAALFPFEKPERADPPAALTVVFAGPASPFPGVPALPPGGRLLLLLGWPIAELPYHLLLDPLVAAGCQVLQAVPVDRAHRHGVHCAVVAARVDRLAPLRSYLDDSPITLDGESPGLPALLRLTGEYTFTDLVSRTQRS
ncbi:hypothetical protein ACWT_7614 [Actinoplanes sp. SE50]|uniref:hypothetical protein n=2 Tax=Actinoplanes TaxID=1865 RepID=UPI00023EDD87|nr:hypothetical protein [Actinoplanes sp. SE50/110]AEV88625.1 hypothetical protein ACPL_7745 [Actinoplanes sp. SE50/110]ATO87029.1 hypothetical protein ACWT_7614 [Actinoplanes sp. SE50]SLM04447.1 hypothetical protein ACSP50_7752 [Actinoplanes sp. SE50/110]